MITLAKYHVCNHCVIGKKTFQNILIGPGKLPGLSRNGSLAHNSDLWRKAVRSLDNGEFWNKRILQI